MADYAFKYNTKVRGKQKSHHFTEMSGMPTLAAAQTQARGELTEMQLRNPGGIRITSAMVRRLPAGNWHSVL